MIRFKLSPIVNNTKLTASSGGTIGLLSTKEATKAWRISRYALRRLVDEGVIHPILIGSRNWKFDPNSYYDILTICKSK